MRKTLTLLLASTALAAAIGVPAWSATRTAVDDGPRPAAALADDAPRTAPVILASSDEDEGDEDEGDEDDDEEDDDDEDDDEDDAEDDGAGRAGAANPAPAGAVPPPSNGLFGNGAAPQVQVN